jgi:uridine kinase
VDDLIELDRLAERIQEGPARLGACRLVTIDGLAGAGKSTLAASLATSLSHVAVIHLDDLYEGWNGLNDECFDRLDRWILQPLRLGLPARYERYDWALATFGAEVIAQPEPYVIVEGVGAGDVVTRPWATLRVWLEISEEAGVARGMARDLAASPSGEGLAAAKENWALWQRNQAAYFAATENRVAADVRIVTH